MNKLLHFGESITGYDVPVLNEREVRASAGILFLFALISFMNSWLLGDFQLTQIFVIAFLIDFSIRIFINPRFAPSMILGRLAVGKQQPEWAGAPQKRFAWAVGWSLAIAMFYLIVLNNVIGPVNLIICATCLTLLFFESAFGICLACKVYNIFHRQQAQHCPGGVCEVLTPHASQKAGAGGLVIVALFLITVGFIAQERFPATDVKMVNTESAAADPAPTSPMGDRDCTPPDWAVAMGHTEKWKLHNNCI
ncbi:MAG: DUF4395 domain-containing protein [Gammaproteobacteria bacterium]|jgi:hypothetical protein|nr:DUF4395 domain-containing protein [Gammaproteobacteria bacterium]